MAALPHPFQTLCRAYFNADWDLDGLDGRSIVATFADENPPDYVAAARDEATRLLDQTSSEVELRAHLEAVGLVFYTPEDEGLTYRQWLELVVSTTADRAV